MQGQKKRKTCYCHEAANPTDTQGTEAKTRHTFKAHFLSETESRIAGGGGKTIKDLCSQKDSWKRQGSTKS